MYPLRPWAIAALLLAAAPLGCAVLPSGQAPVTQAPAFGIGEALFEGPATYHVLARPTAKKHPKPVATPTPTPVATPTPVPVATPTPTPVATPTPTPSATASTSTSPYTPTLTATQLTVAQQVLALCNTRRAAAGAKPLVLDTPLMGVATFRSQDMATRNYFAHNDPEGRSPFWHLTAAGISYSSAAENIAYGYGTADAVVTAWMNSTGHRANIMNPNLGKLGVGYVKNSAGTPYWTQLFTN